MFPPALDLANLTDEQAQALRSWLVAHVNVTPRQVPPGAKKRGQRSRGDDPQHIQLDLW
jgi:deoxyribodipyrimidine photo-lyase